MILCLSQNAWARSKIGDRFTISLYNQTLNSTLSIGPTVDQIETLNAQNISVLKADYKTNASTEQGVRVSFKGLGISYGEPVPVEESLVAQKGLTKGDNYQLSYNFRRHALQVYYKNITGFHLDNMKDFDPEWNPSDDHLQFPNMRIVSSGFEVLHVFNEKDFRVQSILDQSDIQKKSGGSWLAGLGMSVLRVESDTPLALEQQRSNFSEEEALISEFEVAEYSLKFGYGHNWVSDAGLFFAVGFLFGRSGYQTFHSGDRDTKITYNDDAYAILAALGINRRNWFLSFALRDTGNSVRYETFDASTSHQTYQAALGIRF